MKAICTVLEFDVPTPNLKLNFVVLIPLKM